MRRILNRYFQLKLKVKKKTIFISLLTLLILSGYGLYIFNRDIYVLWNTNSINVITEASLSKEKVKIEYGYNSINRKNDKEMFINRDRKTILYDGKTADKLVNEYGENDFLITYDDKYYFDFRQFKFNRRHQHDYNFYFYQKSNTLFVKVDIQGEDDMKFESPMLEIANAEKYLCNVPIEK
jgi:hypothetical protein